MSSQKTAISAQSLAELALVVTRVTQCSLDSVKIPSSASLLAFWRNHRSLQQHWMKSLDDWTSAQTYDIDHLSEIAIPFFTCDLLVRVWGTTLAGIDVQRGRDDLIHIARNAVSSFLVIRNAILLRLLKVPEAQSNRILELELVRRRCERWNDVLIGCMAPHCFCFEFAFSEERARDFGEDNSIVRPAAGPNVADHMISASLRQNFIRHLPQQPLEGPDFRELMQSVMSNMPIGAMNRDDSFQALLDQKVAIGRQREQRHVAVPVYPRRNDSTTMSPPSKMFMKNHRQN